MDNPHLDYLQSAIGDIAKTRLDPAAAIDWVSDPAFGGIAVFVGKVRAHNHGREVEAVHYDIFAPLAERVFARIAEAARAQFGPRLKLHISHAHGALPVGAVAVVIAAGTPHRAEAFAACRFAIEEVKHHAPIWKQEHYRDGCSEWSQGCALCAPAEGA